MEYRPSHSSNKDKMKQNDITKEHSNKIEHINRKKLQQKCGLLERTINSKTVEGGLNTLHAG